jgi:hypothetical protein
VKNIFKSVHLAYPPGHFYSPICNSETLIGYRDSSRNGEVPLPGIDLNNGARLVRSCHVTGSPVACETTATCEEYF